MHLVSLFLACLFLVRISGWKGAILKFLVVVLRIPKELGVPLSVGLTWSLGVFLGKWVMGYQGSHEEYYHEEKTE